jgi:hypothetical protein
MDLAGPLLDLQRGTPGKDVRTMKYKSGSVLINETVKTELRHRQCFCSKMLEVKVDLDAEGWINQISIGNDTDRSLTMPKRTRAGLLERVMTVCKACKRRIQVGTFKA